MQKNAVEFRRMQTMHDNAEQFIAMYDNAKTVEGQCIKFQDRVRRRVICKALHPA
jgi:hypothetical protein